MKITIILAVFMLTACTSDGRIRSEALGGAVGGGTGAAIGSEIGGRNGAIIGGAIGGATGAAMGNNREIQRDRDDYPDERYESGDNGNHYGQYKKKHKKKKKYEDDDEDDD